MSDRNAITISFAVVRRELSLEDDDESTSLKLEMSLPIFMLNWYSLLDTPSHSPSRARSVSSSCKSSLIRILTTYRYLIISIRFVAVSLMLDLSCVGDLSGDTLWSLIEIFPCQTEIEGEEVEVWEGRLIWVGQQLHGMKRSQLNLTSHCNHCSIFVATSIEARQEDRF
jgi:hypothetical protein